MGSLLPAAPASDDPDPEAPSVAIDIGNDGGGDTGLETRMARLLQARAEEQHRLEQRLRQLEGLQIASVVAEAAASSAASAAASAEAAAKLIETSEKAVQCAAEVMEVAREAVKQLSADGVIPDLLRCCGRACRRPLCKSRSRTPCPKLCAPPTTARSRRGTCGFSPRRTTSSRCG